MTYTSRDVLEKMAADLEADAQMYQDTASHCRHQARFDPKRAAMHHANAARLSRRSVSRRSTAAAIRSTIAIDDQTTTG